MKENAKKFLNKLMVAGMVLSASDVTAMRNQNAGEQAEAKDQSKSIAELIYEIDEELKETSDTEKQNDKEIPDAFIQQMVGMNESQIEKCWKVYCANRTNLSDCVNNKAIQAILGDNVDDLISESSLSNFEPNGIALGNMTYIQLMALWGSIKCFKQAISTNRYKLEGIAPYAIVGGNTEIIHILEQKGISFDNVTDNPLVLQFIKHDLLNWLPQHYELDMNKTIINAIQTRMFKYAWALLRFAKTENETLQYDDILLSAVEYGNLSIVKHLIEECKCDVKAIKGFFKPLHCASMGGRLSIVKYLIEECKCDVNIKDNNGKTPLCFASMDGYLDIVKYLIEECKCDVNIKDNSGRTPLYFASVCDHLNIVKYLIEECKYNKETKNEYGQTALLLASFHGHLDIVKYLIEEYHCDVNAKNEYGYTSLHYASVCDHLDIVRYLVEEHHARITDRMIRLAKNDDTKRYLQKKCNAEITDKMTERAKNDKIKGYLIS